jgi:hypothetical protein
MERCCKCYARAVRTTAKLKLYTENLKKVVITQDDLNDWVLVCASMFPINNVLN